MPFTARLSQAFYERLGEQITNELVGWFNDVDATYRGDLRELNELNFARFDAKMEQRFAQHDARWEQRIAQQDAKWEQRIAQQDAKWEQRIAQQDAKWEQRMSAFEVRIEQRLSDQVRWMYVAWAVQLVAILSLWAKK